VNGVRPAGLLLILLAVCASACAAKGSAVVVLLPDSDKTVGRADVENKAGAVDLDQANKGARVRRNQRPTVFMLTDPEVQQMFGDAVSALPAAPQRFVLNFRFDLGLRRAVMVRNLLISAGVDAAQIQVTSLGETDLLVHTPDETAEPRNRRVDIIVR